MNEYERVHAEIRRDAAASGDFYGSVKEYTARAELVKQFAWAIPCDEAIAFLVACSPIVEMFAGSGYWASLVAAAGGDIVCYDKAPAGEHFTDGHLWFPVLEGEPAILSAHADRTLFMCWPPYDDDAAVIALDAYKGSRIVYVGEHAEGCCANRAFFDRLDREWDEKLCVGIPQWKNIHDDFYVFERG